MSAADATGAHTASRQQRERRRATPRPWYRRLVFVAPLVLLCVAIVTVGVLGLRLRGAVSTVQSVSTPAPFLSGAALGGDPSIQIDTGPARAAAASLSSETPTPTPTPAVDKEIAAVVPTSGAALSSLDAAMLPTEPPSQRTGDALVPTEPSAEDTPPLVEHSTRPPAGEMAGDNMLANPGFEDGDTGWYAEGSAGVVKADSRTGDYALLLGREGGYASQDVPVAQDTTYTLSGWGKVSGPGEEGSIGVVFRDDQGERLQDLEPEPLIFTGVTYEEASFTFTPSDEVASIAVFVYKDPGDADLHVDDVFLTNPALSVAEAATETPPSLAAPVVPVPPTNAMNVLVMGVDARSGEPIDIGVRPDSLMVLRLNPDTGSCRVLAIPRDTRTNLPGYGLTKVNHALAVGGIHYQRDVVEELLEMEIDRYALIDFAGFETMVELVDGVTMTVPAAFTAANGMEFAAGEQTLGGSEALAYVRHRGGPDGDFGRINRQQQVLRALLSRAAGLNLARSIDDLLPAVEAHLRSDLSLGEIKGLAETYRSSCTEATIQMSWLEGNVATLHDPMLNQPLSYVVVDEDEVRRKVAELAAP